MKLCMLLECRGCVNIVTATIPLHSCARCVNIETWDVSHIWGCTLVRSSGSGGLPGAHLTAVALTSHQAPGVALHGNQELMRWRSVDVAQCLCM